MHSRFPENRLPEEALAFFAPQMVMALEHLERNEVIHRDIKAENYLLRASGFLMLSDFGLSTSVGSTDSMGKFADGALVGTPEVR